MVASMINSKPVGRVLPLRVQLIAVLTSLLLSSIALAALAEDKSAKESEKSEKNASAATAAADVAPVFNEIEALVKEYYPKAKVVRTPHSLHFDYKARGLAGVQSGLHELSPDSGGVAGDIVVKPGRYAGRDRNPGETNYILHMVYFTAPYSEPEDHHFFTKLSYPPDAAVDFLSRFKTIIGDTKKGAQEIAVKPAAAPTTPPPAVQPASAPAATTAAVASATPGTTPGADATKKPEGGSSQDAASALAVAPNSKELTAAKVSFGAKKLSKYSYPEGRFKVLLPGNPACKYSNTLGMRSVDYSYPEPHGAYVVSYLIAPGMVIQDKISPLLDAICGSIAKTTKSVEVRRNSLTLQGYQGRQIELAPAAGKDQLARFRLYVVRRFIYIIGAAGNKAWVDSPVVAEYLNSLEVVPEYTYAELRAQQSALADKHREESRRESEARAAKSHQEFEDARNRNRKEFEKSQADWKYRRY